MTAKDAFELCLALPVQTVLDLGPGDGVHLRAFQERGKPVAAICPPVQNMFNYVPFHFL